MSANMQDEVTIHAVIGANPDALHCAEALCLGVVSCNVILFSARATGRILIPTAYLLLLAGVLHRGDDCAFEAGVIKLARCICSDAAGAVAFAACLPLEHLQSIANNRAPELQSAYEQLTQLLQSANAAPTCGASIGPDQHRKRELPAVSQSMSSFSDELRARSGPRVPTLRSQAGNAILRASFSGGHTGDEIRAAPGPHLAGDTTSLDAGRGLHSSVDAEAASPRSPFAALHMRNSSAGAEGSLTPDAVQHVALPAQQQWPAAFARAGRCCGALKRSTAEPAGSQSTQDARQHALLNPACIQRSRGAIKATEPFCALSRCACAVLLP